MLLPHRGASAHSSKTFAQGLSRRREIIGPLESAPLIAFPQFPDKFVEVSGDPCTRHVHSVLRRIGTYARLNGYVVAKDFMNRPSLATFGSFAFIATLH